MSIAESILVVGLVAVAAWFWVAIMNLDAKCKREAEQMKRNDWRHGYKSDEK